MADMPFSPTSSPNCCLDYHFATACDAPSNNTLRSPHRGAFLLPGC